jgi:hypothetical protein
MLDALEVGSPKPKMRFDNQTLVFFPFQILGVSFAQPDDDNIKLYYNFIVRTTQFGIWNIKTKPKTSSLLN